MNRNRPRAVLTESLAEHPAVQAWAVATGQEAEPKLLHVLRERRVNAMYWIPGLGVNGAPVFAKRGRADQTRIERKVYEEILPELPLTVPRYYGSALNGRFGWIFVEDVGNDRYCQAEPAHREVAARWLATMHTESTRISAVRSLPDAGPGRYLQQLRDARARILSSLRSWSFGSDEVRVLKGILSECDTIEKRWDRVEAVGHGVPSTLAHCDFQEKNAFLKKDAGGLSIWLIDWEMAGFGHPAPDLTRIDLQAYWHAIRPEWPSLSFEGVERLACVGGLFQWLAAIAWESLSLQCEHQRDRADSVADLDRYLPRLSDAARSAGVLE